MTKENIDKITSKHVETGQTFQSYAALCRELGIVATTGKQRVNDQTVLQRYFMWDKVPGTNKLTITETYYDTPKIPEDGRKGIYTTHLNSLMQDMILSTLWSEKECTKRDMLLQMRLIPSKNIITFHTFAPWYYTNKMNALLNSAITQLGKKGYMIHALTICKEDSRILSKTDENTYKRIKKKILSELGATNLYMVYLKGLEEEFWSKLDDTCMETLGYSKIRELVRINIPVINTDIQVDRMMFIGDVVDLLCQNFGKKHRGIGKDKSFFFRQEMEFFVKEIA